MKRQSAFLILAFILGIAFFLRIYRLGENPPALYIDEASFGYNAYSILKTGRDEFGVFLPIFTRSFSINYKDPVYLYSTAASVRFFGLNEFAVRLPAAVFGTMAVFFTFLLAFELWRSRWNALLAAFLLAVSPWNFHLSRFAIEAVSLSCVLTAGVYFLVRSLRQSRYAFLAAVLLALCFYSYAPAFSFVPMFLIVFVFIFRGTLKLRWKYYLGAFPIFFVMIFPLVFPSVRGEVQSKYFKEQLITNPAHRKFSIELLKASGFPGVKYIENRPALVTGAVFLRNYLSCFSYRFLFTAGDTSTSRQHVRRFGVLHRAELIFICAGVLFCLLRGGGNNILILLWVLIFPVGPGLTTQWVPQLTRLVCALPVYQLLGAVGVSWILSTLYRSSRLKIVCGFIAFAFILAIGFSTATYFLAYFRDYPKYSANAWGYGMREAIRGAEEIKGYDVVVIDETIPFVYIYPLFYLRWDPARLLRESPLRFHGLYRVGALDKYLVGPIRLCPWPMRCLYITRPPAPSFAKVVRVFSYPGVAPNFVISSSNKR